MGAKVMPPAKPCCCPSPHRTASAIKSGRAAYSVPSRRANCRCNTGSSMGGGGPAGGSGGGGGDGGPGGGGGEGGPGGGGGGGGARGGGGGGARGGGGGGGTPGAAPPGGGGRGWGVGGGVFGGEPRGSPPPTSPSLEPNNRPVAEVNPRLGKVPRHEPALDAPLELVEEDVAVAVKVDARLPVRDVELDEAGAQPGERVQERDGVPAITGFDRECVGHCVDPFRSGGRRCAGRVRACLVECCAGGARGQARPSAAFGNSAKRRPKKASETSAAVAVATIPTIGASTLTA